MIQVKHYNGFIYNTSFYLTSYTKYKSYWAKLNTNETQKTFQRFIHHNDPLLATINSLQILGILSTKDRR